MLLQWKNKNKINNSGFTLIELMVAMAIVGIVSAMAMAGYVSWKPGNVFRGAVSQVRSDLNRAKMRAVATRRQCRVVFTANGYQIEDGDRVMNSTTWAPFQIKTFSEFPQVTIDTAHTVGFSPRGTAAPLDTIRVLHPNTAGADIAVGITGRINITWL